LRTGACWRVQRLESLSREQLIQIILDQHRLIEELRAEIEQLKRRSSAAPFSKGTHKPDPKPPGRKPGEGIFRRRIGPPSVPGVEPLRVPVASRCCPECGGALGEWREEMVSITDIAAEPRPELRVYAVEAGRCQRCGKVVRGQHSDIAAGQQGATAHRLGPRIKALAHILHYVHGVPVRKSPAILEELTGVRVTQGAITQDAIKHTQGAVGARYGQLREAVKEQAVVYTDDTGWRVAGKTAFLMAFVNPLFSVYQIRSRHRNEEVRELIPADFGGVVVCDRGKSYDAEELGGVAQQKCLAHLIRNVAEVGRTKSGAAGQFSRKLKDLLRSALVLRTERATLGAEAYAKRAEKLDEELTRHLRHRTLRDGDNQRLLDGIGINHDQGHVLRFLGEEAVEPTNNRAERDLRPAVISRKVSHCSRNATGGRAFEAFTSVLQTIRKTTSTGVATAFVRVTHGAAAAPS
jgi:transposase